MQNYSFATQIMTSLVTRPNLLLMTVNDLWTLEYLHLTYMVVHTLNTNTYHYFQYQRAVSTKSYPLLIPVYVRMYNLMHLNFACM